MDYFDALLRGSPTRDRMGEAARQLRREQAYGVLGQLTGDPLMGAVGGGMVQRANERAQGLQRARQAASTARALGGCSYEQGGEIKEIPGCMEAKERELEGRLLIQALKNQGKDEFRKLTASMENRAQTQAANLENLKMLRESFDPKYAQPLREVMGEAGAAMGPLHNLSLWAARTFGAGTEQAKDAEEWYGTWRRFMTLPVRNELFGATLTPSEQKAWDAALEIQPGMKDTQIQSRMDALFEEAERSAKRRAKTMLTENYRPATVKSIYGGALGPEFFDTEETPEGGGAGKSYASAEEVRAAFEAGEIETEEEAVRILQTQFGMD